MKAIPVEIVRLLSRDWPGWVECKFIDAQGRVHFVHDKVPIFTSEDLHSGSQFPQSAYLACTELEFELDECGCEVVLVTTSKPWGISSVEELDTFRIFQSDLIDI